VNHIIAWELKQRKNAILWWSIGSVLLTVMILALYPSIRDQARDFNQVINQLPEGLRNLKTGSAGSVDVANPVEFLNSQLFYATLPILWIILAITRGNSALGSEENTKTIELLLSRPLSRSTLIFAKVIAIIAEFLIVTGITLVAILALAPVFDISVGAWQLSLATLFTALFSLSFGIFVLACHAFGGRLKRLAVPLSILLSFGGYVITSLSGLTDWLKNPAKVVPYHYFEPERLLEEKSTPGLYVYLLTIALALFLAIYIRFTKRDIE
jgi:ABC-2 type transport system permease protein